MTKRTKELKIESLSFEEALAQLEAIVDTLERGNIPLAQSLEAFEKGMALASVCAGQLTEAEKKIELLVADKDGKITLKPANIIQDCGENQDEF